MNVILYSTDCPKCVILETKLRNKNVDFEINYNVDNMIELGFVQAPVLSVDGKCMPFGEANDWINKQ